MSQPCGNIKLAGMQSRNSEVHCLAFIQNTNPQQIEISLATRGGVVVIVSARHAEDPGSIHATTNPHMAPRATTQHHMTRHATISLDIPPQLPHGTTRHQLPPHDTTCHRMPPHGTTCHTCAALSEPCVRNAGCAAGRRARPERLELPTLRLPASRSD